MMEVIRLGVEHLCSEILGYEVSEASTLNGEFYGSALPLYKGESEFDFYLYFKKDTLNRFAKVLLHSDNLNEDDLSDLCKEVANLIIGYSKNLLNEQENGAYKLGTPEYLGRIENFKIKLEDKRIYKIKNRTFQIGYKRA